MGKILWLIAARSGSKSVPHKNIRELAGLPLLAYRIKTAAAIARKEDVWISTDSQEYADIAKRYGATVPFLRPEELAGDLAKSVDVVLHAMEYAEKLGFSYEAIGLLEPTSPFVPSSALSDAAELLLNDEEADAIVAVRQVRPSTFYVQEEGKYLDVLARNIREAGVLRRQDEKREVTPSGGFYIAKWNSFKREKTFYTEKTLSWLLPDENSLEIDEPMDWLWAQFVLERQIVKAESLWRSQDVKS